METDTLLIFCMILIALYCMFVLNCAINDYHYHQVKKAEIDQSKQVNISDSKREKSVILQKLKKENQSIRENDECIFKDSNELDFSIISKNESELYYWLSLLSLNIFLGWTKFFSEIISLTFREYEKTLTGIGNSMNSVFSGMRSILDNFKFIIIIDFNFEISSFLKFWKKKWITFKLDKFICTVNQIKCEDEKNSFEGYDDLINLIKQADPNLPEIAKWFDKLRNNIKNSIPNELWLLKNKIDDKIYFSIRLYASAKQLTNIIPNINDDNAIIWIRKIFAIYTEKLKEISNQEAIENELKDTNSNQWLPQIYETMLYNFWRASGLNSIITDIDGYYQIENKLSNKIKEEIELSLWFLLGNVIDYWNPKLPYSFQEEIDKKFKYIDQCLNIQNLDEIILEIQFDFEKKFKNILIKHIFEPLQHLNNLLSNEKQLILAISWLIKIKPILNAFKKSNLMDYIALKFQKVERNLSNAMNKYLNAKAILNLEACIRIVCKLKEFDEKSNSLYSFTNLYRKYVGSVKEIDEELKLCLNERDIISFCLNFKELSEDSKKKFIGKLKDQIRDVLKGYMEGVWERLKQKALEMSPNNIDDFFNEMKKVAEIIGYMDFNTNIEISEICKWIEMKGKILITENNIKNWDNIINGLPTIFKKWEEKFISWATVIPPEEKIGSSSQNVSLPYNDELKKINIEYLSYKLLLIFKSCKERKNWIGEIIKKFYDGNIEKNYMDKIITPIMRELINSISDVTKNCEGDESIINKILLKIQNHVQYIIFQDFPDYLFKYRDLLENLNASITIYIFLHELSPKKQSEIVNNIEIINSQENDSSSILKSEEKKQLIFGETKIEYSEDIKPESKSSDSNPYEIENQSKVSPKLLNQILMNNLKNCKFNKKAIWQEKRSDPDLNLSLNSIKKPEEIGKSRMHKTCLSQKNQNCNSIVEFSLKDSLWRKIKEWKSDVDFILKQIWSNLKIENLILSFPKNNECVGLTVVRSEKSQRRKLKNQDFSLSIIKLEINKVFGIKPVMKAKPLEYNPAKNIEFDRCSYSALSKTSLDLERLENHKMNFIYEIKMLEFDASSLYLLQSNNYYEIAKNEKFIDLLLYSKHGVVMARLSHSKLHELMNFKHLYIT